MLDSESNKLIDAMIAEIQSMIDNMGYTQLYGVDYEETLSPVADIRAIRILISISAYYDYDIWKIDVKTAFLNGYLDEDIYMEQPEGFVNPNHPRKNKTQGASTPEEVKLMQNVPYASAVGSIMYAVRCTRPDVAFAQNITSRFQQNHEAKFRVDCYCDAGFKTDRDDTKSQTGYVFILNGGAVD
ncbi:retrotransposon protein, putative, ty1-copia subclass [Tanacetum coccineum]